MSIFPELSSHSLQTMYTKAVASDVKLLPEVVQRQLGIITYNPNVLPWNDVIPMPSAYPEKEAAMKIASSSGAVKAPVVQAHTYLATQTIREAQNMMQQGRYSGSICYWPVGTGELFPKHLRRYKQNYA